VGGEIECVWGGREEKKGGGGKIDIRQKRTPMPKKINSVGEKRKISCKGLLGSNESTL